jgi:phosphatidylglycerophosphate synthase
LTGILGGFPDWLDGRLARRRGRTRLGRDLDSTADRLDAVREYGRNDRGSSNN